MAQDTGTEKREDELLAEAKVAILKMIPRINTLSEASCHAVLHLATAYTVLDRGKVPGAANG